MQWLNAALAFSITMLVLSMVVSTIVETLHRLFQLRADGLRVMLGQLFDTLITPHLGGDPKTLPAQRDDFVSVMMSNRAEPQTWIARRLNSECLQKLDLEQFMTRLGASHYGDALRMTMRRVGGDVADGVLHDIAQQFAAFGQEASDHFERRARLTSVIVALALAWCANVNPYSLLKTYVTQEKVTENIIRLKDSVLADYEKALKAAQGAPANGTPAQADLASIEAAKTSATARIQNLQDLGSPIGWTPDRLRDSGFAYLCMVRVAVPVELSVRALTTMFWLLMGGLLIGLGGPFWFDAVRSLSSLRSAATAPPPDDNSKNVQAAAMSTAAVASFKTASMGRDARLGQGGFAQGDDEPALG